MSALATARPRQWVGSITCPVHKNPVPVAADGSLAGYCPKCLGEAANALERMGYAWRLKGYVPLPRQKLPRQKAIA